ncbi:MAG TPA: rod-binding protein [Armatimonadota bacterium]|nr:rod-binding protein [Armatimonadota bacterium]
MDINNIGQAAQTISSSKSTRQVVSKPTDNTDPALMKVCVEFESLLATQMLKKMRESVPKTDLFGSRDKEEMFQDMLDQEVCLNLSKSGSIGLAEVLYQQLSMQKTAKVSAKPVDKLCGADPVDQIQADTKDKG